MIKTRLAQIKPSKMNLLILAIEMKINAKVKTKSMNKCSYVQSNR